MASFNKADLKYVVEACTLAKSFDIDTMIFENGSTRGLHEDSSILITDSNTPEFDDFTSLGIGRVGLFLQRYGFVSDTQKHTAELDVGPNDSVTKVTFAAPKIPKVEFRCTDISTIPRVPTKINDVAKCEFTLDEDALRFVNRAMGAYSAERVTLLCVNGELKLEISDVNNDVIQYVVSDSVVDLETDSPSSFSKRYPIKPFLAVFKQAIGQPITYGKKHTLRTEVAGLTVHLFAMM